jgi:hypothetical protein
MDLPFVCTHADEDEVKYCLGVYRLFLQHLSTTPTAPPATPEKYYYQYEFDGNNYTIYEALMAEHWIVIKAQNYADAMVLNVILRSLLDGHFGCFVGFAERDDDSVDDDERKAGEITIKQLLDRIMASDAMDMYRDYVQDQPIAKKAGVFEYKRWVYEVNHEKTRELGKLVSKPIVENQLTVALPGEVVFDRDKVTAILNSPMIEAMMDGDQQSRVEFVLKYECGG